MLFDRCLSTWTPLRRNLGHAHPVIGETLEEGDPLSITQPSSTASSLQPRMGQSSKLEIWLISRLGRR